MAISADAGGPLLDAPRPLQLVVIDPVHEKVEVNDSALREFEESLRASGAEELAVVSITGAFRSGKSLLLDLFLRFLRYEEENRDHVANPDFRMNGPVVAPPWAAGRGPLEGASQECADGFRFAGGMDACTRGIWVWSKPFKRKVGDREIAVVLMDTQGAFDASQTRAESVTIFGLARLLSSRHIYNVQQQIAEDSIHNLTYFLSFAQAVFYNEGSRGAGGSSSSSAPRRRFRRGVRSADSKPFQSLDFIVRDWRWMESGWDMAQCRKQMQKHLTCHIEAQNVKDAAELLKSMVGHTDCWCFPHPGDSATDPAWTGEIRDIDPTFLYFVDAYAKEIFNEGPHGLSSATNFGYGLSRETFGPILRNYVGAFHRCAQTASSLLQALSSSTALQAKDRAERHYKKEMSREIAESTYGLDDEAFRKANTRTALQIKDEFQSDAFCSSTADADQTWSNIEESLTQLKDEFVAANNRQYERALVGFKLHALFAFTLFLTSKLLEVTLTWWSQNAFWFNNVLEMVLLLLVLRISVSAFGLYAERGGSALLIGLITLIEEVMKWVATPWMSSSRSGSAGRNANPLSVMNGAVSLAAASSAREQK